MIAVMGQGGFQGNRDKLAAARAVSRATVITAAVRVDVPARETAQSLSIPISKN